MKLLIAKFALFALVALTVGVTAGRAQITTQLNFKVSQSFVVGNTTLAAGSYIIRPVSGTDQTVVEITTASGKPSVMAEVELVSPPAGPNGKPAHFQ